MKVELRRFNDDGDVITVGTIELTNEGVVGDTRVAQRVASEPVGADRLTSADGMKFMEALHTNISGSYLWATKPM